MFKLKTIFFLITLFLFRQSFSQLPGSLDSLFGFDGIIQTDFYLKSDIIYSVCLQEDEKIVVAGTIDDDIHSGFAIVRYQPDGTIDTDFGTDGRTFVNFPAEYAIPVSIALQSDGKIVVGGYAVIIDDEDINFALIRLTSEGVLDESFGESGIVQIDFGGTDIPNCMVIKDDDKIILAGASDANPDEIVGDIAIACSNADGTPDYGFNFDGKLLMPIGIGDDIAYSIALQSDGKIIIGGIAVPDEPELLIARVTTDGYLDETFGAEGKFFTHFLPSDLEWVLGLAIQADDRIIANVLVSASEDYTGMIRLTPEGDLDTTFNHTGMLKININDYTSPDYDELLSSIELQADEKVIVAGYITDPAIHSDNFAIFRFNNNGSPDITFGIDGLVITPINDIKDDRINDIAVTDGGRLIAAGYSVNDGNADFAIAKYITTLFLNVLDFSMDDRLLIYPMPISSEATLEYSLSTDMDLGIDMIDMNGSRILNLQPNEFNSAGLHKKVITIPESLPAGIYIISLHSSLGSINVQLIKQ